MVFIFNLQVFALLIIQFSYATCRISPTQFHFDMAEEETTSRAVLELRLAKSDDLDEITNIAIAAFETDPEWQYRFPYRHQYPEDHWACTREPYKQILEAGAGEEGGSLVMHVVTLKTEGSTERARPIAVSIWEHLQSNDTVLNRQSKFIAHAIMYVVALCALS